MGRNFVIFYVAREGSSAIISRLSLHPEIAIPVFEELDRFWIERIKYDRDISFALDHTLSSKKLPFPESRLFEKFIPRHPTGAETSCGFKWRPHGSIRKIVSIFKKHDVQVFFLFRRNLKELVSSLYFTNSVRYPDGSRNIGHYQFRMTKLNQDEAESLKDYISSQTVTLDKKKFLRFALRRTIAAMYFRILKGIFFISGIKSKNIFYEDFNENPEKFISDILEKIELPKTEIDLSRSKFKKSIRSEYSDIISDLEEIDKDPKFILLERAYRRIIAQ